jgi:hypothetical protein
VGVGDRSSRVFQDLYAGEPSAGRSISNTTITTGISSHCLEAFSVFVILHDLVGTARTAFLSLYFILFYSAYDLLNFKDNFNFLVLVAKGPAQQLCMKKEHF